MLPVIVHYNNVDAALRTLKRKTQKEGITKEQKMRRFHMKKSVRKCQKKAEAMRRVRKNLQRRMAKEGF